MQQEIIGQNAENVNGKLEFSSAEQWFIHPAYAKHIIEIQGKRPITTGWNRHEGTPDLVRAFIARGSNLGMLGREFCAIDGDITAPGLAKIARDLALEILGSAPCRGRDDSPKWLLQYVGNGLRKRRFECTTEDGKTHAVELLATGQQYAIHGRHPDGCMYRWDREPDPWNASVITAEQIDTYFRTLADRFVRIAGATITKNGLGGALATARSRDQDTLLAPGGPDEALAALKAWREARGAAHSEHYPHDKFVELCAAFRGATGDAADELYEDFLSLAPGGRDVDDNTHKTYHSFGDVALGWSRLCEITNYVSPTTSFAAYPLPDDAALPADPGDAFSHHALALTFADKHVGDLQFVPDVGWHQWTANRWSLDKKNAAKNLSRQICRDTAQYVPLEGNNA
jgi:hypothetical protein